MEPPGSPDSDTPPTQRLEPDVMRALLAAGGSGVTRELRGGWQPPGVEDLQRMLPQYEIVEFIARGGMGAVYRGVQRTLDRTVAIKILPPDLVDDGDANYAERFKQEARAMAKFKHPGIVTVYEAGEVVVGKTRRQGEEETRRGGEGRALAPASAAGRSDGNDAAWDDIGGTGPSRRAEDSPPYPTLLYFVMEFIEGTDVAQLVAAQGRLPSQEAIRITTAVCDALAYAHARGVVHRDIKPSNIMIDADGQVKVADFGLAKITTHESGGLTKSSVAMGTPDFVAPEAMIAGTLVDQRADLYAVGVMLYQMLTGHIPRGRFSPVSAVVPKSDPKLDAIVDKAMQTDREKRYSSAAELKADVEKVAPGFPWGLRSSPHDARTGDRDAERGRTRHALKPMTTLAAAAAVIMLGTGGWWAFNRTSSKMDARPQAAAPVSASPAVGVSTPSPATATKEAPFENTLGMKFVPVPITGGPTDGQRVLFSIWETRVQDYETFAMETKRDWPKPDAEPGGTHPAVSITWKDATVYCAWLTERERRAGKLASDMTYRLPSDHEWSCAVGIGEREDAGRMPMQKNKSVPNVFPWGTIWPPPNHSGNYWSEELRPLLVMSKYDSILKKDESPPGYQDGYATTAPVGSYAANRFGIYDLGGNVVEWCVDWADEGHVNRIWRGASWRNGRLDALLSSMRAGHPPDDERKDNLSNGVGFRVVLAPGVQPTIATPATATKEAPFENTLGMKFVPVPITSGPTDGQRVLFSIWETRVQDYEAFAKETKREWSAPTGTDRTIPAVSMIRDDAKAFCVWLTERERAAGRLGSDMTYRLPTDHEWSCAVGIGDREDAAAAPTTKNNHLPGIYPWGGEWPPPKDAGNFADESYRRGPENKPDDSLPYYDDGFASIAPVGSFASNRVGLFDLAGNVIEIVEAFDGVNRFGRGSSWRAATKSSLQSDLRVINEATHASNLVGFRVVLAPGASAPKAASAQPSSDRVAAEWVLGLGGSVTLKAGGQTLKPKSVAELPTGPFAIVEVRLETLKNPVASLAPLAELAELASLTLVGAAIRDETLSTLGSPPNLKALIIDQSSITDVATGSIGKLRLLERLTLSKNKAFTGRRLGELALPRLFSLALQRSAIADEALKQIALLKNLRELDLCYTPVTDAGMGTLTPLHRLVMLQISNAKVTSAGLAALGPAVPLQRLEWTFPREGGKAQFEKVAAAFPQLSAFCLETTGYLPGDIPVLATLSGVRELQLLGDGVTDEMMQELLHLPQITSIYIRDCQQFTGRGLTHLIGHPSIASVKLEDLDQITDADVLQLTAMKRLSSLKVLNCKQITPASFDAFRRARPEVKVERQ